MRKGQKMSAEQKRKISEAHKGKHNSIRTEFKKGLIPWNKGKPRSEEVKRKIRNTKEKNGNPLKGIPLPIEHRRKISEALKGDKSYMWKGGMSKENEVIRKSMEYRQWRTDVFVKDNYTCQKCGSKNGEGKDIYLQAHHILNFSSNEDKRFDIENGITFCIDCHNIFHKMFGSFNNTLKQVTSFIR